MIVRGAPVFGGRNVPVPAAKVPCGRAVIGGR